MNDKYLSVITNFGCHYSCAYCIVKNNHLNIPKTTIHGLNNLFSEIVKNRCKQRCTRGTNKIKKKR